MYEIHVTVENADEESFAQLCTEQKARPILIELPPGADHQLQLMCSKWVTGSFDVAEKAARAFSMAAKEKGFTPIREKIEQAFSGAPDDFIPSKNKGEYWEFHYKIHLPDSATRSADLASSLLKHEVWSKNARMSRSALRDKSPDGSVYRIVTLRLYDGRKQEAREKCEKLKEWLMEQGYDVMKVQREVSVYDDHINLDNGWL